METSPEDYIEIVKDKELVYLSSDATDTLTELDPNCAYIIGGIVDRNSMKGATFRKATQQGIRTAKLPLKEYCSMSSTPVLTVNHVFEILIRYRELGSWTEAFSKVLPQRKGVNTLESSSCNVTISQSHDSYGSDSDSKGGIKEGDDGDGEEGDREKAEEGGNDNQQEFSNTR